ncbi:hypothetical protein AB0E25_37695 [Streptomyces bobili]|uniref:hypothetical protein n=1 Tax=Streptomyces bobili TaxID=67280 RepID=UPI0033EE9D37
MIDTIAFKYRTGTPRINHLEGDLDRVVAVDSTIVRAHQHAGRGPSKGARGSAHRGRDGQR